MGRVTDFANSIQVREQTPSHEHNLAFPGIPAQPDHGLEGLRRYVVRLSEIRDRGSVHMEVLSNTLLI
jgi:hypothetical protein